MISPTPQMASYLPPLPESFGNPMLRGMHEILPPEAISWLPTAPGWYVLAAVLGVLLLRWLSTMARRWLRNGYRREALRRLSTLHDHNAINPITVNELLKTTAIVASSRREVATLTGDAWVVWLRRRMPDRHPIALLTTVLSSELYRTPASHRQNLHDSLDHEPPYEPYAAAVDAAQLRRETWQWLRQHRDDHEPA